jgi:hypothetical protein
VSIALNPHESLAAGPFPAARSTAAPTILRPIHQAVTDTTPRGSTSLTAHVIAIVHVVILIAGFALGAWTIATQFSGTVRNGGVDGAYPAAGEFINLAPK